MAAPHLVFAPGEPVFIGPHTAPICATVERVEISARRHTVYRCVWWNGRARCAEWIPQSQVRTNGETGQYIPIGFERHRRDE